MVTTSFIIKSLPIFCLLQVTVATSIDIRLLDHKPTGIQYTPTWSAMKVNPQIFYAIYPDPKNFQLREYQIPFDLQNYADNEVDWTPKIAPDGVERSFTLNLKADGKESSLVLVQNGDDTSKFVIHTDRPKIERVDGEMRVTKQFLPQKFGADDFKRANFQFSSSHHTFVQYQDDRMVITKRESDVAVTPDSKNVVEVVPYEDSRIRKGSGNSRPYIVYYNAASQMYYNAAPQNVMCAIAFVAQKNDSTMCYYAIIDNKFPLEGDKPEDIERLKLEPIKIKSLHPNSPPRQNNNNKQNFAFKCDGEYISATIHCDGVSKKTVVSIVSAQKEQSDSSKPDTAQKPKPKSATMPKPDTAQKPKPKSATMPPQKASAARGFWNSQRQNVDEPVYQK